MQCSSCGVSYDNADHSLECSTPAPGTDAEAGLGAIPQSASSEVDAFSQTNGGRSSSTLIEFPGVARTTVPEWRQELSERVREVQERRARAASSTDRSSAEDVAAAPQLELLPPTPPPEINPLVAAALRRIERANRQKEGPFAPTRYAARATVAVAHASVNVVEACEASDGPPDIPKQTVDEERPVEPEKSHNLTVVPPSQARVVSPAPRRLISENDPALNYLTTIPTTIRVEEISELRAPLGSRLAGAVVDLVVIAVLSLPFAAAVELTNTNWHEIRTAVFAAGVASTMTFLYLTISIALTGRTLGMKMLSLRVVDKRTGLIPTGAQSAGRALIYLISLLTLGVATIYALFERDGYTAHDQLTRTAVVRT